MPTALSVLSKLGFKQLRPGENQEGFVFSGPGVVVIACEAASSRLSEVHFSLITAVSAETDALEVATRLLKQGWNCDGYVFALLASVEERGARLEAVASLSPMCTAST